MGSKQMAVRVGAAALMIAGSFASVGIAAADPDPTPEPAPAPAPSVAPAPAGAPAAAPKTIIDHDGIYTVGKDIAPGTYVTPGPVGTGTCYWKRTGNPDGALIDNAMTKKPQIVQIDPTDQTFKTSGCQPWQPTSESPPPNTPGPQVQAGLGILNGLLAPHGP